MNTNNNSKKKRTSSLSREIFLRVAGIATLIVAAITAGAYFITFSATKQESLDRLKQYVSTRVRNESKIFQLAEDNLEIFKKEFLHLYQANADFSGKDFWTVYDRHPDGSVRMKKKYFDGIIFSEGHRIYGMSSFIGSNQPVDDPDLQRRLILAFRLISRLGPAWVNRFANLHASFPENAIVIFMPEEPWGLKAESDLRMNELGVIRQTLEKNNPERKPVWTGLYFDETIKEWMITYQLPVDYNGRHLINPSHDIHLTDLMNRLISEHLPGSHNLVFRKDGLLVAYPENPTEEQQTLGQLSPDEIQDPAIASIYNCLQNENAFHSDEVRLIDDPQNNAYLATAPITGPDWWFVSVYPKNLISQVAHSSSRIVLFLGLLLTAAFMAVVYFVIRNHAAKPLKLLKLASERIGAGEYREVAQEIITLPTSLNNEAGILARTFKTMAQQIDHINTNLENLIKERTEKLKSTNEKLKLIIREMNHRIKNNLTLILSSTRLSKSEVKSREAEDALDSIISRITLVSLIHEMLVYEPVGKHIQLKNYLEKLLDRISKSMIRDDRIKITWRIKSEELPENLKLTDLGIIATELVLNSIKHTDQRQGSASISLMIYSEEKSLIIEVFNPISLPPPSKPETDLGSGMLIVDSLLSQINGTKSIRTDGGEYHIKIVIPY